MQRVDWMRMATDVSWFETVLHKSSETRRIAGHLLGRSKEFSVSSWRTDPFGEKCENFFVIGGNCAS